MYTITKKKKKGKKSQNQRHESGPQACREIHTDDTQSTIHQSTRNDDWHRFARPIDAPETNEEIGEDGDSRKLGVTSRKKPRSRSHKSRSNRRIEADYGRASSYRSPVEGNKWRVSARADISLRSLESVSGIFIRR